MLGGERARRALASDLLLRCESDSAAGIHASMPHAGYLELLSQLTTVGEVSQAEYVGGWLLPRKV